MKAQAVVGLKKSPHKATIQNYTALADSIQNWVKRKLQAGIPPTHTTNITITYHKSINTDYQQVKHNQQHNHVDFRRGETSSETHFNKAEANRSVSPDPQ
jgi:hypothetical protein